VTQYHESKIVALIGPCNGVNTTFETPTRFVAGTLRVFMNGQACESADGRKGWAEITDNVLQMVLPPVPGDVLQAFYADKDISGQLGLEDVRGTPFDPNGVLP
jgi:hypothetical protein